jgi:hypothetical protein
MQTKITLPTLMALLLTLALTFPLMAQEEKAKKKAEKARGDVGLLDTEKNYLILVTKEGKLITLDFDGKTKVIQLRPEEAKVADVGLGASAEVEYVTKGEKNVLTKMEFRAAKGGE